MTTMVTTQEELDAAVKSGAGGIVIDSPPTVWLELRGSPYVVTQGSSHVVARVTAVNEWSLWDEGARLLANCAVCPIHEAAAELAAYLTKDLT